MIRLLRKLHFTHVEVPDTSNVISSFDVRNIARIHLLVNHSRGFALCLRQDDIDEFLSSIFLKKSTNLG
jgi:hypothetical protein